MYVKIRKQKTLYLKNCQEDIFLQIFLYFAKSQIRLQLLEIFIIETKHLPQNRFCPYAPRFSPESSAQKLSPFGAAIYAPALTSS